VNGAVVVPAQYGQLVLTADSIGFFATGPLAFATRALVPLFCIFLKKLAGTAGSPLGRCSEDARQTAGLCTQMPAPA
jgi:hypothetical protein